MGWLASLDIGHWRSLDGVADSNAIEHVVSNYRVGIIGGGWAGLSAATALSGLGCQVTLFERSRILGGRSGSFWDKDFGEWLDHGHHLFIGAYTESLRLLKLWGSHDYIDFIDNNQIMWLLQNGGRNYFSLNGSLFGSLASVLNFDLLNLKEKITLLRGLNRLRSYQLANGRKSLTVKKVLYPVGAENGATGDFFQTLCLAVMNAPIEAASALPLANTLKAGLLETNTSGAIGFPRKPLKEVVSDAAARFLRLQNVEIITGMDIRHLSRDDRRWLVRTEVDEFRFEAVIIATSPTDVSRLLPVNKFGNIFSFGSNSLQFSPITEIHCTFDRPVLNFKFAHLHHGLAHWVFGRGEAESGKYRRVSFLISHRRLERSETGVEPIRAIIDDLGNRLPAVREANLVQSRIIKNVRATILITPEIDFIRPDNRLSLDGLFIAGDWCNTGLPATIESAARSGRRAAELAIYGIV